MGEDPGSEVEPKGHEHEVKNLLYHEAIFRGRIVLEFFDSCFRLQYTLLISSRDCLATVYINPST